MTPTIRWLRAPCESSLCVEAAWIRGCEASTCVEAAWLRACTNCSSCVEVHAGPDRVLIRDSKHPDGPVITLTMAEWWEFVRLAAGWDRSARAYLGDGLVLVPLDPPRASDERVCMRVAGVLGVHLHFTEAEWDAFVGGLRSGAFDSIGREAP